MSDQTSPHNLAEKLEKMLHESGIEGAIIFMYRKPDEAEPGDDLVGYSYATNGMSDQYAIGTLMRIFGQKLVDGAIRNGELRKDNRPPEGTAQ